MTRTVFRLAVLGLLLGGAIAGFWLGTAPAEEPHDRAPAAVHAVSSPSRGPAQSPSPTPTISVPSPTHSPPQSPSSTPMPPEPSPTPTPTLPPLPTPTLSPTPAPTYTLQPTETPIIYTVQAGDTLGAIARAHDVTVEAIIALNDLDDPDLIREGQVLQLPSAEASVALQTASTPTSTRTPVPPMPGATATALLLPTPAVTVTTGIGLASLQDRFLLGPVAHDYQRMNNCAPTTLAMTLSFFGETLTQYDLAPVLKGSDADKNVSPAELVAYLHELGYGAVLRINGDLSILMHLVSNGVPVIVEQWLDRPGDELTGHYRVVRGYDRSAQVMIVNDSYNGPELSMPYTEFDRLWWPFNRLYIAVYRPEDEPLALAILGDEVDDEMMYQRAAAEARAAVDANAQDAYAWYNLGADLLALGEYDEAVQAFEQAMEIGLPPRMFWYQFGPFEAYNEAGQYQKVLNLSAPVLAVVPMIEELHYRRGLAYLGLGDEKRAAEEFRTTLEYNPRFHEAAVALSALEERPAGPAP